MSGLLDGGAQISVVGKTFLEFARNLNLRSLPAFTSVMTADSTGHKIQSYYELPMFFKGLNKVLKAAYVPTISEFLILGMDFWDTFSIKPVICLISEREERKQPSVTIDHELSIPQAERLQKVLLRMPFSRDGVLSRTHLLQHTIDTNDATPIKQRHYCVSPYIQEEINKEIDRLLALDVIEPCPYSAWSNPVVAVKKPNGKVRVCLDARKLNSVTAKDAYPQQQINRILARLGSTKYLSAIDFSDAFLQVPLDETSRCKTAFAVSGRGFFCYKRMPFGLCNSGATLCRLIDRVIGCDLEPNVFVYLDDIIVATETLEQHIELLEKIANRITDAGLTVSPLKSKFCARELNYLGYIVDERGVRPNPEKISAMSEYPIPKSIRDVKRLFGVASWYRRFIPNFATVTAPITELLKKSPRKFDWTPEANVAFERVKEILVSEPVLACPDYSKKFIIQCDASNSGIGGILVQGEGDDERVIAYMSEKLSSAERKYQTTERECLAVIRSIEKFRPYIEGCRFTVVTDHASLLWLTNLKDPSGRVGRWALRLQAHDFDLMHRKGKFMVVADALSRAVCSMTVEPSDQWYGRLRDKIQQCPNRYSQFQIKDKLLYKYCAKGNLASGFSSSWKLVVPDSRRAEVMKRCHDDPISAHQGFFKTANKIKLEHYWPKMDNDIRAYVRNCSVCKSAKPANKIQRAFMGNQRKTNRPWQMIQLDFMGPFPRSKRGFSYLLVVIDTFSKFVRLCPLRRATSKLTVNYLENEVFLLFGVPEIIISDNGSQFVSAEFKKFLAGYGVTQWLTAAYHPQANATEAANKTIGIAIRSYIQNDSNHRDWDLNIHKIACALNSSIHTSTKCSPFLANFGQNMVISPPSYVLRTHENAARSSEQFDRIRVAITENLKNAYVSSKRRYDLRARPVVYQVGDTVWKEVVSQSDAVGGFSAKFAPKYVKCVVKRKLGSNTYELVDEKGGTHKKVSCSNIKS